MLKLSMWQCSIILHEKMGLTTWSIHLSKNPKGKEETYTNVSSNCYWSNSNVSLFKRGSIDTFASKTIAVT